MTVVWTDWLQKQPTPARELTAKSVAEVETLLRNTPAPLADRFKVRSSGHATSAVGRPEPNKFLIRLDAANWQRNQGADWLPAALPDGRVPYWTPASCTLRALNAELAAKGLALGNLGSYDGQTIYGAIATGTHGTGIAFGPLADCVLALDLTYVGKDAAGKRQVRSIRLERAQGITVRAHYDRDNHGNPELVNDTAAFRAAVVSFGLFGVVTGLVLAVEKEYWLKEERVLQTWSTLRASPFDPTNDVRVDVSVTALPEHGEHYTLLTRRSAAAIGQQVTDRNDQRTKKAKEKNASHGHDRIATSRALAAEGSQFPKAANHFAICQLKGDADLPPWTSRSDKVLLNSIGEWVAATSAEVAIPAEEWRPAVAALIQKLDDLAKDEYHLISPLGVRFCKSTDHLLAHTAGRASCTVEIPTLLGVHRRNGPDDEISSTSDIIHVVGTLEDVLVSNFDGRPHWGQRSFVNAATVKARYGASWDAWKTQRAHFDPFGVFDNEFSRRYGL